MGTNAHPRSQFLGRRCAARIMGWIIGIITTILGIAAGFGGGVLYRKRVAERAIGSAEEEATRLVNEAIRCLLYTSDAAAD